MSPSIDACPRIPSRRSQPASTSSAARRALGHSPLVAATLLLTLTSGAARASSPSSAQPAKNYGHLPMRFEANQGQSAAAVRFSARGAGYAVYLTDSEAVLALRRPGKTDADTVRMQLQGANTALEPTGVDRLQGQSNYFIGNDSSRWRTEIPAFSMVRFSAVYDGIDLVYYGNQQRLEYDFVVAPRADPRSIRLHFAGADTYELDPEGNLVITAPGGQIGSRSQSFTR